MRLLCPAHGEIEEFTPGEVERIVYALAGMEADERCEANDVGAAVERMDAGRDALLNGTCLRMALDYSRDVEFYAEFVTSCVEARRGR